MDVEVYKLGVSIASLRFTVVQGAWSLVRQDLWVEGTADVEAAIRRVVQSVTTDVFQPSGRTVELDDISYVATSGVAN